jgi:nitroimidazol reductase NimA-like FMN-containing flavoprotein (pyridoxamine 5'-phosphate oxidase superfamily)
MRNSKRQVTDLNAIKRILDLCDTCHLALQDDDAPYVVPVSYGYTLDEDGRLTLYFHGAKAGKKYKALGKNGRIGFCISKMLEVRGQGTDACGYTAKYASLIGQGRAEELQTADEKSAALNALMRKVADEGDYVYAERELAATGVFAIIVEDYTAKSNADI